MTGAPFRTFSGRVVDLLDFKHTDVDSQTIAHHLACVNRFGGAVPAPVSVAQHSVYVAELCRGEAPWVQLQAILHDASEAYVGDVTKWFKHSAAMDGYRNVEERIQQCIYDVFRVPCYELHPAVKAADMLMVRFEGEYGFGPEWTVGHPDYPKLTSLETASVGPWKPWRWEVARAIYHDRLVEVVAAHSATS